ncbi:MAG: 3-phosphoshikimate 1-carboxyvinyltransferase [Thermoplasmata archaeon]|nr:3-phosphoshikimate 1-carboxyvinyltransferase [Thermoplasmata archaeon]MCI4359480.1 3-phosphoshikimate 1-carboxyvinyltransferase [Thermoplasmata archaeon]
MSQLEVHPSVLRGDATAPPSKSYTHRELVASFFSDGRSDLLGPLVSDDTLATCRGLSRLGARITPSKGGWSVEPPGPRRSPSVGSVSLDCGGSGTTLRFLLAVAATRDVPVTLLGTAQLALRPVDPLLDLLENAGASVQRASRGRSVPTTIRGPIRSVRGRIDGSKSSQYLSALLLSLPSLPGVHRVRVEGARVSAPYIEATQDVLLRRGVRWTVAGREFRIEGPVRYGPRRTRIPGDASSAAYLWAGAAVSGGSVRVRGIPPGRPQADLKMLEILRRLGAHVLPRHDGAVVQGARLRGVSVNLADAPDLLPLVAALAARSSSVSRIHGALHAAVKESDRRKGSADLVRGLGARAVLTRNLLEVRPALRSGPVVWKGSLDHRLVMSAAIACLGGSGAGRVGDARAVGKSFPGFWSQLRALGARMEAVRR